MTTSVLTIAPQTRRWMPMTTLLAIALVGCAPAQEAPVDQLRLELIGGQRGDSVQAVLDRDGESSWMRRGSAVGNLSSGTLPMTPDRFDEIVEALRPYRSIALAQSSLSATELANPLCEPGESFVPNQDELQIQWTIGEVTHRAFVPFGCDPGRHAARYAQLRRLIEELEIGGTGGR